MATSNDHYLDPGGPYTLHDGKRKAMQREFAPILRTGGSTLRRVGDHVNRSGKPVGNLSSAHRATREVPIKSRFVLRRYFV
jgi:hypothetical protein